MLATAYEKMDGNYGRWSVIREIDGETFQRAREIFSSYKKQGVVLNESFDEDIWRLTNQATNVNISLHGFEGAFHKRGSASKTRITHAKENQLIFCFTYAAQHKLCCITTWKMLLLNRLMQHNL